MIIMDMFTLCILLAWFFIEWYSASIYQFCDTPRYTNPIAAQHDWPQLDNLRRPNMIKWYFKNSTANFQTKKSNQKSTERKPNILGSRWSLELNGWFSPGEVGREGTGKKQNTVWIMQERRWMFRRWCFFVLKKDAKPINLSNLHLGLVFHVGRRMFFPQQ